MKKAPRIGILFCAILLWTFFGGAVFRSAPNVEPELIEVYLPEGDPVPLAPAPEAEPAPEQPAEQRLTLVVGGDLMAHGDQLADAYRESSGRYDFFHCFELLEGDLAEGYAIGNLETVFGGEEAGYSDYPQFNTPDSFGEALRECGFDFLTTANNHSLDVGEAGLLRTLEVLDELGFAHTGTFASQEERDTLCLVEVEGLRIAFVSCTFSTNGIPVPDGKDYLINTMDETQVFGDLQRARESDADLVVVLPHMGNEYESEPRAPFEAWMDRMFENGADIILASHPHVLQRMEVRTVRDEHGNERDGFVIYSLGNLISSQREAPRDAGVLLKLDLVKVGDGPVVLERVRFVPTWVQFTDVWGGSLVRVLPVGDALLDWAGGDNVLALREQDVARLEAAHAATTALFLGESVPLDEAQREYVFYERGEGDIPAGRGRDVP